MDLIQRKGSVTGRRERVRGGDKMKKGRAREGKRRRAQLLPDWISASDSLKLPQICISTYSLTFLLKIAASLVKKLYRFLTGIDLL